MATDQERARADLADRVARAVLSMPWEELSAAEAGGRGENAVLRQRIERVLAAVEEKASLDVIGDLVVYERDDPSTGDAAPVAVVDGDGRSVLPGGEDLAEAVAVAEGFVVERVARTHRVGRQYASYGRVRLRIERRP